MRRAHMRGLTACAIVAAGVLAVWALPGAQGTAVTRGPYLQSGHPTGVTVRWRTSGPTDSMVRYGTAPGSLDRTAHRVQVGTEHVVAHTGLAPLTRYYYSVGTSASTLAGGTPDFSFVTAPPAGAHAPTRLWVLGDSGTANASAAAVRNAYLATTGERGTDLWLMLGDNAYPTGTDAQYQAAVFDMYRTTLRQAVLWPAFGNHDAFSAHAGSQTGVYFDTFTLPAGGDAGGVPSGTEAYYAFDYANIHFICLDSFGSSRLPGSPMLTWLEQDLAAATAEWIVAFWHHPPYSKGSHDSDAAAEIELREMRQHVLPILEAGGVDLVLTGHSHSYERSVLLDHHYGPSPTLTPDMRIDAGDGRDAGTGVYRKTGGAHGGAVYAVAGSSGQVTPAPLNHPAMLVSLGVLGSLVIDVDGARLDARFIDAAGTVRDEFAIVKHAPGAPLVPPSDVHGEVTAGLARIRWRSGAGGGVPAGFRLEAGSTPGSSNLGAIARPTAPAVFAASGVGPGTYFLRVRPMTASGEVGPASSEIALHVGADGHSRPGAPGPLTATVSGGQVVLSWTPPPSGPPVLAYDVEAGRTPGAADIATVQAPAPAFTVSGVAPGLYYVRTRARNLAGAGPATDDVMVVVGAVATPPAAPTNLRFAQRGRQVWLAWEAPTRGTVTQYVLEAGSQPDVSSVARIATGSAATSATVSGVPPGTYFVRVRGLNGIGAGPPSRDVRIVVP